MPVALYTLVLAACSRATELRPIAYEFEDKPHEKAIHLVYRNDSGRTMCLLPEHWPNDAGKINQASNFVFLLVGEEKFAIENFNTGYCIPGPGAPCATRVLSGGILRASIGYGQFRLPERLFESAKTLEFHPLAFTCSAER